MGKRPLLLTHHPLIFKPILHLDVDTYPGDVSYHHALEAESLGIFLIDAGHFRTEKAAFRVFGKY